MKKTAFLGLIAFMLVLGFVSCGTVPDELAGTVWNGRRENTYEYSLEINDGKFTWDIENRWLPVLFKITEDNFEEDLVGTVWEGRWIFEDETIDSDVSHRLEFTDETTAGQSWEPLDTIAYTLEDNTINFVYTEIKEGTLIFGDNSDFIYKDSNTHAVGTYSIEGNNFTLIGNWLSGDTLEEEIELTGTISGNTFTLHDGHFWNLRIYNKDDEPWYQ